MLLALSVPIREPDPARSLAPLALAAKSGRGEQMSARLLDPEDLIERAQSPLHRLKHALHPAVTYAYAALPLFAPMNVGRSGGCGRLQRGVAGCAAGPGAR